MTPVFGHMALNGQGIEGLKRDIPANLPQDKAHNIINHPCASNQPTKVTITYNVK
jgi:hypothetical protein